MNNDKYEEALLKVFDFIAQHKIIFTFIAFVTIIIMMVIGLMIKAYMIKLGFGLLSIFGFD